MILYFLTFVENIFERLLNLIGVFRNSDIYRSLCEYPYIFAVNYFGPFKISC